MGPGDAIIGVLPLRPGEEIKVLDLAERGVAFFPRFWPNSSAAGRWPRPKSWKSNGSREFRGLRPPGPGRETLRISSPGAGGRQAGPGPPGPGGQPLALPGSPLQPGGPPGAHVPLVVQPFLDGARDVRVVVLADYVEAYERVNPHSFRKNLFQGGSSQPAALTPEQQNFCRQVMARGRFPYAILDLLLDPRDGRPYLSEISFTGGLTGARLSQPEFRRHVAALEEDFIQQWETSSKTRP